MGFQSERVATMHVAFVGPRYADEARRVATLNRILDRIAAIPKVVVAGGSTSLPPVRMQQGSGFSIEGDPPSRPNEEPTAIFVPATAGFLSALGVPLIRGRHFTNADDAAAPRVAVVSRELARRYFGSRDPLGRRIRIQDSLHTIVGIVGDVPYDGLGKAAQTVLYVPFAQSPFGGAWIAIRCEVDPQQLITPIRDAVQAVDPLMHPRELRPMDEVLSDATVRPRFQTWLLGTFGGLGLLIAAVGIYGVVTYSVSQRTAETGLRLALGAPRASVVGLVLRRELLPVVIGLVFGIVGAIALTRVMAGLLYGISPTDVPTFTAATLLLGAVAVVSACFPAWRAARLDPIRALRSD